MTTALSIAKDRNFVIYASGNAVSWTGTWMQRTGIGWLSWDLTESPSWVGMIALAQYLPLIFIAPLFGVLVDNADRRRYAIVIQLLLMGLGVGLCALQFSGYLTVYLLFGYCLLLGVVNSAYQPLRLTLIHDIAPPERLTQAIGTNSILFNATRLIGPALGGAAIVAFGVGATFLINALSHLASLTSLLIIEIRATKPKRREGGIFQQFSEGVAYALADLRIRELLFLSLIISILARGVMELLPAFAGGEFDSGSGGLAMLMAGLGAGAIAAGFLLSGARDDRRLSNLVRCGCYWAGVSIAVFGAIGYYPAAVAMTVLIGILTTLSSVGMQVILQANLDGAYRGRVVSLWGMTSVAGPAIGAGLLGVLAQFFDLKTVTVLSGILCALLCSTTVRRSDHFNGEQRKSDPYKAGAQR